MKDWDALLAFALTPSDAIATPYYSAPAVKVTSNGRAFVSFGNEDPARVQAVVARARGQAATRKPGRPRKRT